MNLTSKTGKRQNPFKQFFNVVRPQITRNMEDKAQGFVRDGVKNDFPDYLIKTVTDSPHAVAAMERLQSFVRGKGFNDEALEQLEVNDGENFMDIHERLANDLAFSRRFAVKIIPTAGKKIDSLHHIPFESVRYALPNEQNEINYVAVNPKFNTSDERVADTKHYPLFRPRVGFDNLSQDIADYAAAYPDKPDFPGYVYFYSETSEKNRTYSRPGYFAAKDFMRTDAKIGEFHNRNTDNNFFLGGIISVVGNPDEGILNESGEAYTTVGEEFDKQFGRTFSGAAEGGRWMIDWVQTPDDATQVTAWPGTSNHEMFTVLEGICKERISISIGIPQILQGIPTAGKLGDNQEIRNAIKFTNETTEHLRSRLMRFYSSIIEYLPVPVPEEGLMIEKIKDFTDLPDMVVGLLKSDQLEAYLLETFDIQPSEEEETPEPQLIIEDVNDPSNIDE